MSRADVSPLERTFRTLDGGARIWSQGAYDGAIALLHTLRSIPWEDRIDAMALFVMTGLRLDTPDKRTEVGSHE